MTKKLIPNVAVKRWKSSIRKTSVRPPSQGDNPVQLKSCKANESHSLMLNGGGGGGGQSKIKRFLGPRPEGIYLIKDTIHL
jgi:hypothetical protein